jgi:hypothetical protein
MKLKTVVLVGGAAAVGYLFGTRAGRGQFERIKSRANEFAHDPRVRSGVSNVAGEVRKNADKLPDPVATVVRTAADKVESATKSDEQVVAEDTSTAGGTPPSTPPTTPPSDTPPQSDFR